MGCANTKTGGAAGCGSAEDCIPEGGDTTAQKEVPKVMVDGDEMAANGNVVNTNGVEEAYPSKSNLFYSTTVEGKEPACNGDLTENKRTSKAASEVNEEDRKSAGVTTPSGDAKSHELNGGDAVMAADDGEGEKETATNGTKNEDDQADQGKDESKEADGSSPTDDAAESRENKQDGDE